MSSVKNLSRIGAACKVSRRRFLEGSAALGISLAAASRVSAPARAASPNKGGHAKFGFDSGSTSDSLDPVTFDSVFNQTLGYGTLRNSLTEITNDNKLGPELAESWEASDDAAEWTFKIRRDVEFHNGKALTVDDVVASINYNRGDDTKSPAKSLLENVEEVRADGPDRVIFKLASGNADFPYFLSDYVLCILPSQDGKVDAVSGVGTGPYVLAEFEPGVRAIAERNPNYFKQDRAHFDSVEFLSLKDVTARTNALQTGEVHMMNRCDLKTVHLLERSPEIDVHQVTGLQHYTMPMNTTEAPFDDNNVRLALKYAIDRERLLQTVLRGYGKVGNDQPIAPANEFYAEDLEQRAYDPDKARFHLKQAGLDSLSVRLSAADAAFPGAVDAAVLYRENAAKAGIDIEVVREPNDGYWSNVWMKKPWCMSYWAGRPTASQMFQTAFAADAPWNEAFWRNETFNKLLVEARTTLDPKKRAEMYREMQILVRDDGGVVIPLFASYVGASNTSLAHDSLGGNYDMDGLKIAERWWFA
jgi:peptide/nickel transport system substrate-binding protein